MPNLFLTVPTQRERRTAELRASEARVVNRLAADAEVIGWRRAALQNLAGLRDLFQYVGDERAADWRFLLPRLPQGLVLCLGGALSPVPITLASTARQVVVVDTEANGRFLAVRAAQEEVRNIEVVVSPGDGVVSGKYDLVAVLRASPCVREQLWRGTQPRGLVPTLAQDGHLYVEVDHPALRYPPALVRRDLERVGLTDVTLYWPKPTFARCEMLMPLGDRRLQRYYLSHVFFAMSPGRRLLRGLLSATVRLGLFELTLPCYAVLAKRGGPEAQL